MSPWVIGLDIRGAFHCLADHPPVQVRTNPRRPPRRGRLSVGEPDEGEGRRDSAVTHQPRREEVMKDLFVFVRICRSRDLDQSLDYGEKLRL